MPLQHHGKAIHSLKGKPAQIAPRMQGEHPMPSTVGQVQAIAAAQAKMHVALQQLRSSANRVKATRVTCGWWNYRCKVDRKALQEGREPP